MIQCISHEIEANQARLLKPFGISSTQLSIVHTLDLHVADFMTVNEIKDQMVDDSPNVSRSLSGLEKMGFVTKTRDENDQRIVIVRLTELGHELHLNVDKVMMASPDKLALSEDEIDQLYELLKKV